MHLLRKYLIVFAAAAAFVACADEDSATNTAELSADAGLRMNDPGASMSTPGNNTVMPPSPSGADTQMNGSSDMPMGGTATTPSTQDTPTPMPSDMTGNGEDSGNGNADASPNTPNIPPLMPGEAPMPNDPDDSDAMAAGGNLKCSDLGGCINTCAPDDAMCIQGCFDSLDAEGNQKYDALSMCVNNSGCAPDDDACVDAACNAEIVACSFDRYAYGEKTCGDIKPCIDMCDAQMPPSNDCYDGCFEGHAADPAQMGTDHVPPSLELWDNFIDCARSSVCDSLDCAIDACPAEYGLCAGGADAGMPGVEPVMPEAPAEAGCATLYECR
ncbi:MAG: hypothetical protein VX589_07885, partial [Myxococcota bacterium]|nr:hypothetical protein [Myxococcota bacterium]